MPGRPSNELRAREEDRGCSALRRVHPLSVPPVGTEEPGTLAIRRAGAARMVRERWLRELLEPDRVPGRGGRRRQAERKDEVPPTAEADGRGSRARRISPRGVPG